ncbi:hypothetical protein [Sphingobium sp. SA2]|uniref:hypothetical protein n=1 Tax=Sphingobium sp. SA2 TaxID=1524832 RepID=UPI00391BDB7A
MRMMIMMVVGLGLTACGGNDAPTAAANNQVAPETGAAAQVAQLDDAQRNGVLERAIRASGAPCPVVSQSVRTEVRKGVMGWKARCDNDTAHLIEITSDGTGRVTSRRD